MKKSYSLAMLAGGFGAFTGFSQQSHLGTDEGIVAGVIVGLLWALVGYGIGRWLDNRKKM